MQYPNGEISVSPKVVYWIGIPSELEKDERLNLLKNDILIIEHNGDSNSLCELRNSSSKYTAYFYNLDNLLLNNKVSQDDIHTFSLNVAMFIENLIPERSLVHTSLIDNSIGDLFRKHGISFLEKNLKEKRIALTTLISTIRPFFIEKGRVERSALRIIVLPMKFKIEIKNLNNKIDQLIIGSIKDFSLNGLCFRLNLKSDLMFFKLKDKLKLRLFINRNVIDIDMACIIRIDDKINEIGVSFNIKDEKMIKADSANCLAFIVYNWLISIIRRYGKIESSGNINTIGDF
jgi:hypothetical protein